MKRYISTSEKETKKIAQKLAKKFGSGVIALTGELGAGKTTFVQGFAKGLGIKEKIISPTFILIRSHKLPRSTSVLYHIDLYRLEGTQDFKSLGLEEILSDPNNLILIEWAEKLKKIPKDTIKISIEKLSENSRRIKVW